MKKKKIINGDERAWGNSKKEDDSDHCSKACIQTEMLCTESENIVF